MATRTVRLDDESERVLARIVRETGLPVSAALKKGLLALSREIQAASTANPYDLYQTLDLGAGGWSIASASQTRRAVREAIRRKHER
jgi:hypothetical protein